MFLRAINESPEEQQSVEASGAVTFPDGTFETKAGVVRSFSRDFLLTFQMRFIKRSSCLNQQQITSFLIYLLIKKLVMDLKPKIVIDKKFFQELTKRILASKPDAEKRRQEEKKTWLERNMDDLKDFKITDPVVLKRQEEWKRNQERIQQEKEIADAKRKLDSLNTGKRAKKRHKSKTKMVGVPGDLSDDDIQDEEDDGRITELEEFLEKYGVKKEEPYKGYSTYLSTHNFYLMNSTIECEGCHETFRAHRPASSKYKNGDGHYMAHVTQICPAYASLDKIAVCHDCKLIFRNRHSRGAHLASDHKTDKIPKPEWMSQGTYQVVSHLHFDCTAECPGCKQHYPARFERTKGYFHPSIEYWIHCVENCDAYKNLNLIRTCGECNCKFLSPKALGRHVYFSGHDAGYTPPRPEWMDPKIYNRCAMHLTFSTTIECEGCGQTFPGRRVGSFATQPRFDY